jgi:hypothetical protein
MKYNMLQTETVLRDRFNRLRSSTFNLHNRDMSMAYQASRLELFRDYDCVDAD